MHYITKIKDKNHMIIPTDAQKIFDKIKHPFIIKMFIKVDIEGTYLNIINDIYDKSTDNIISVVKI